MMATHTLFPADAWRSRASGSTTRELAEETPVAISYNGSTHAVLMATPSDLEDLARGFSITEGIATCASDIEAVEVVAFENGLDVQVRIPGSIADRLAARRRSMAGPVGCGLCGLESLEAAARPSPVVSGEQTFSPEAISRAVAAMSDHQALNAATSAAHAAAFFLRDGTIVCLREDVGRHNALDKLIGALLADGIDPGAGGFGVTSRVSVELVQKAAAVGCGLIAAVSAPTAYAVRTADAARITIAAIVRGTAFEVFTHRQRVVAGAARDGS